MDSGLSDQQRRSVGTDPPDDGLLVGRAAEGDMAALEELVRRHQTSIYRFCLVMTRDSHVAEDLTQSVFVKTSLKLRDLRDPQAFRRWLRVMARSAVADWYRTRARRGWNQDVSLSESMTVGHTDPDIKDAVNAVLDALSSSDREVLLLADLLGLSMRELAEVVGLGESAAKMRLARARAKFRKLYESLTGGSDE